jgi:hypothetical protein
MTSDLDEHEAIKARSMAHLKQACETAAKKRKYDSRDTRTRLESIFSERSGFKPYEWQLDVAEAIHPDKMALIISPLKVLQQDQVRFLRPLTY